MSTLSVATVKSRDANPPTVKNSSDVEIGQFCRAWVNFVGSTGVRRSSFNVSSVTRITAGQWDVNFATALSSADFVMFASGTDDNASARRIYESGTYGQNRTTSKVRVQSETGDAQGVYVAIFGS